MNIIKVALGVLTLIVVFPSMSLAQEPTKADKAIKAVKELCLTGTQYDLKADAQGNLTLLKLAPGATGSVSVNVRSSSGAAAIFDDKLRKEADKDTRNCIKPYIQKIIDAILQDNSAQNPPSDPTPNKTYNELVGQWLYYLKDKTGMEVYGTFDISNIDSTLTAAGDAWYIGDSPDIANRRGHWTTMPMGIDKSKKKIYMLYDMELYRPNCDEKKAGEAYYKGLMMLDYKGELSPPALGGVIIRVYSKIDRDFSINAVAVNDAVAVNAKKNNRPIEYYQFPDKFKALFNNVNILSQNTKNCIYDESPNSSVKRGTCDRGDRGQGTDRTDHLGRGI